MPFGIAGFAALLLGGIGAADAWSRSTTYVAVLPLVAAIAAAGPAIAFGAPRRVPPVADRAERTESDYEPDSQRQTQATPTGAVDALLREGWQRQANKLSTTTSAAVSVVPDLWHDYKASQAADARERLILHYSPLVKFVAGHVAAGLPQNIEEADLVSYGIFGLIDAIDKFDPARDFKFETYAISRIKGAIIHELRSIDWVPRSVRAKARSIERAYSKLENELRRSPDDKEIAAELGMSKPELDSTLSQISFTGIVALDELLGGRNDDTDDSATLRDTISDGPYDPVEAFEVDEMKHLLADMINRMGDRERLVLTLYYFEGLTLAEVGDVLRVTESRVAQIHTKAILQLRARLSEPA